MLLLKAEEKKTALILIDIQEFYFKGGISELKNPEAAARNAAKLLDYFRIKKKLVVHVKHKASKQSEIHETVKPQPGEKVFTKTDVNSFLNTGLIEFLKKNNIEKVVIAGMMTHMCVEAAVRAASDLGFETVLISDACATKDLKFNDEIIKAEDVHLTTLATLKYYASVVNTDTFLKQN